ncbi:MAG: urease accessory UreF family protein [Verrucomicrobiota bacterium]
MKPTQTRFAAVEAENLLGDFHPLVNQIGSTDGLKLAGAANASLHLDGVKDFAALKIFLENYRTQLLGPIELPLICQAYQHASRSEFSELISLDQQIARDARLDFLATASKRVGQIQLKRLRPLRDQRGLQRYIRAVDSGDAHGWHTLVYGITLASFSFPLRQGLLSYAQQTLDGFVRSSGGANRFSQPDCETLLAEIVATVPRMIDSVLSNPLPALAGLVNQHQR